MTIETNKALMHHYLDAWGKGDTDSLMDMLDKHCVTHHLMTGRKLGVDFEKEACEIWHAGFENTRLRIEKLLAEGDMVSVYWLLIGKHTGEFAGIRATWNDVYVTGMEMSRVVNGKIVEIWRLSDTMSLMQQIGAVQETV